MQITFQSHAIRSALSILAPVIVSNSTISALACVKFEVTPDRLVLTACDLENTITTEIDCQSDDTFSVCIGHESLKKIFDAAKPGEIHLEYTHNEFIKDVQPESHSIIIKTASGKNALPGESTKDFPALPKTTKATTVALTDIAISKIKHCLGFVSTDTLRPAMTGVYLELDNGSLIATATNAHYLFTSERLPIDTMNNGNAIISAKSAKIICELFQGGCQLEFLESKDHTENISMWDEKIRVTARLIDGAYVPFRNIMHTPQRGFSMLKSDLIGAVKYAFTGADKTTRQLRFSISDSGLSVSACDNDYAKECIVEPIPVTNKTVEDFRFSFNGDFLLATIAPLGSVVRFGTDGHPTRSFILTSEGSGDIGLIQPLMILE